MDKRGTDSPTYSSEDEIQRPVVKRKKKAKSALATSSEEEDSDIEIKPRRLTKPLRCESEDENNNGRNGIGSSSSASKKCVNSSHELSDNDQVDKCAICLNKFLGQDIATPETCDHVFCLECIQEWSKNINTCPIDRLKFNLILVRHHKEEKIIQTIVVNKVPSDSDSEESDSENNFCDICGEDKNDGAIFFRCYECSKYYHYHCIVPILPRSHSASWQCPACEHYNWGTAPHRITPSAFRLYRALNSGVENHSPAQSTLLSASQEFLRLRRSVLYPRGAAVIRRRLLSSSDSSEEDTLPNALSSAPYQNPLISSVATNASCPLLKRRRNLCRARNRALVSATSATTESRYSSDSDEDFGLSSSPAPESFDIVGSILESQTRLHRPDILTLTRDGTLLPSPKSTNSSSSSNTAPSPQNSEGSSRSSFPFVDNAISPFTSNAGVRQRPLNPTHSNSSKYGETSMPTYSCSSSGVPRERTSTYDENAIAKQTHGSANSNDRFGNDPISLVVQKGLCVSATGEEIKKDGRPAKGQHSEDEVDIYSDIESVNEEDGLTNDSVEPPKVAYKCDDSQLSNPNESSDSSDNDLVIDEDQHVDEDHEKVKESKNHDPEKIDQICESEESNMSSNAASDQEHLRIDTSPQNMSSPCLENSSDNCYNPGGDSSHGMFVHDASNHSKSNLGGNSSPVVSVNDDSNHSKSNPVDMSPRGVFASDENNHLQMNSEHKDESDSDAGLHTSDVEMVEDGDNSLDSTKKSYLGDVSTPGTSGKSSPKSYRGETADGFENCVSNENSQFNFDNASSFGQEESKEVYEEVSNEENENTCNSGSGEADHSNISEDQVEKDNNFKSENSFFTGSSQNATLSEPEELMDDAASPFIEENTNNVDLIDICNDISMKSDEDNLDSLENASTPCMDENLEGPIENSPMHVEHSEEEVQDDRNTSTNNSDGEKEINENAIEKEEPDTSAMRTSKELSDGSVELGREDISDVGSEGISAELNDEILPPVSTTDQEFDDVERKVASLFSPVHEDDDCIEITKDDGEFKKSLSPQTNQSYEDQEEGEIIEERPVHRCKKKKNRSQHDDTGEFGEYAPRVNISDLPRIPKLKRDKERDSIPKTLPFESKRTSVMSRVDLGEDISWKRLSKHTKERSYRDGRPRDEKLLYRERESRKKSKKSNDASRRNDSKNSERRRDDKKGETEKTKDYDSRSRKSEKSKTSDYDYSDREKRKSHKDKHSSKDRHSKDRREKEKYDKKYSKEDKYSRDKSKDEGRYERDLRFDKEERFERIVHEKGKFKEKEHKSKHKDRKSDSSKTCKEHSREKHKHTHSSEHFSDKQREVRKIDDKIKIVVEQKDSRKEKSKHKERKELKIEKPIIQRRVEPPERSPSYKEITSIESKEIFAKGDSIIINVNFNRASSPKTISVPDGDVNSKDRKVLLEEKETGDIDKSKLKPISQTVSDCLPGKRSITPTGKNSSVLSVSESYWQDGEDPEGNNSPASNKSVEIITIDPENENADSPEANSHSSPETFSVQTGAKDSASVPEKSLSPSNEVNESASKDNDSFGAKRRSPRSPSPPSPADNDSYDPCEPTRSPSPPPMPSPPPLPSANPKPPPSPELPPLPPEPEPIDESHRPKPSDSASSSSLANTVQTQTSSASPMQGMLLPPSFLSRVSAASSLQSMSPLAQASRNGNFQMNNHGLLPPNQMQQLMAGNFLPHMHTNAALPPPPNPPSMAHMTSVPPPPPPPAGMTMLSQTRHPRLPNLNPNTLLQSLTMVHSVNSAPMQLIHHLPPNLSGILGNHQPPMVQNPPTTSHPVSNLAANQQVLRMVFSQNQMSNHGTLLPTQNSNKTQGNVVPLNSQTLAAHQNAQNKHTKRSPSAEKNEVIDMDVGTPYSPGDSPSVDSVADYSPACSPEASSPKNKDAFDTLFTGNQRTSEKRTHDALSSNEKAKTHSGTKKSKHEHKRHAVRMQMKEKHKKSRKEQKQADEAQLKILDELPSSAVEMQVKEKFLKKLNRQERVVEEVKMVLKPFYKSRDVTKEEYKDILRKAVPKICHNRSGEINPVKVKSLVESYVKKAKHSRKKGDKRKSKFS